VIDHAVSQAQGVETGESGTCLGVQTTTVRGVERPPERRRSLCSDSSEMSAEIEVSPVHNDS
jgi:hypothetical protein